MAAALGLSLAAAARAEPPTPVGGEFQINAYTTGEQTRPSAAVEPDGDFVVVWQSFGSGGSDNDGSSIQGQRYAADGDPVGGQFQVNSYTTGFQISPAAAVDVDGRAIVVWQSAGSDGTDNDNSIQGQRYASDLKARAAEIVDQTRRNHRPVLLTRRGRGVAVLMDVEDYQRLADRVAFVDAVEEGARSAGEGNLHPNEEAMRILDSFGE